MSVKPDWAKQPYRIALADGGPFAFAGIWETWRDPAGGDRIRSCAIITTEANGMLKEIHHRMPVILRPNDVGFWLDCEGTALDDALSLLNSYPADELSAFPVSTHVNAVRNDDPECLAPLGDGESSLEKQKSSQPTLI